MAALAAVFVGGLCGVLSSAVLRATVEERIAESLADWADPLRGALKFEQDSLSLRRQVSEFCRQPRDFGGSFFSVHDSDLPESARVCMRVSSPSVGVPET